LHRHAGKALWSDIALQGFFQGILTAIIYGRTVGILDASSEAAFAAM
jgi:hypothetical protein